MNLKEMRERVERHMSRTCIDSMWSNKDVLDLLDAFEEALGLLEQLKPHIQSLALCQKVGVFIAKQQGEQ